MPGFRFAENMYGSYRYLSEGAEPRRFKFHVDAVSDSLVRTLRDGQVKATGFVEADGMAARAPLEGVMIVEPIVRRRIDYRFGFTGDDGTRYRYAGFKTIRHLDPVESWTTLHGKIFDGAGREVATSTTHFDASELLSFLRSYELVRLGEPEADAARPAVVTLTAREREIAIAVAEALLPPGKLFAGGGPRTIDNLPRVLAMLSPAGARGYRALLRFVEHAPLLTHRRRFTRLSVKQRERLLERWAEGSGLSRARTMMLTIPMKTAHFDDPTVYKRLRCTYGEAPKSSEKPAWSRQVLRGDELPDEEIECDVVVVGTGAGGAVVAKELAQAGHAVVMLEEGGYHTRDAFNGRSVDMVTKLYRNRGATFAVGNTVIPIPLGRSVGGTTTINSGTSLRPPDWVLERWAGELGLPELAKDRMEPYFERVERELQVARATPKTLGGAARVVARGCDVLGWSHHALMRNAPECDGQGICHLGCPTDAKRSTNVSYVPKALQRGAMVATGVEVTRVLIEEGRAVGVEGRVVGSGRKVRVRAEAVVMACGALITPAFLMRQGLLPDNPALGRNLTIHPAIAVNALFDEEIRGWEAIPQGYCVDEFHRDGVLMEGSSLQLDGGATSLHLVGRRLMDVMESYDRLAQFGAMISERTSSGRVFLGPGRRPMTYYWLTRDDLSRLQRAIVQIGRIFFAAGATRVFPTVLGWPELRSPSELEAFGKARIEARDVLITAYHPLGTCRVGHDPSQSVTDLSHQVHGVRGLYIVDGSSLPASPTVNPQVTIMAMATRAADGIGRSLA